MKILFHDNYLSLRGTTVSLFDYAHFNETILNNESYIIFNNKSSSNSEKVLQKLTDRFPNKIFSYSNFSEIDTICKKEKIDATYFIKSGNHDGKLTTYSKNLVHAVFQEYQPHGEVYAYVSDWLSKKMTDGKTPFVPHIVNLPKPTKNIRKELGIPEDSFVFARYGGESEFNIPFVKEAIVEYAEKEDSVWFIFFNTIPFCDHPRIKFFEGFSDMQFKSNVIESSDAMIHARLMGESFGLAICEFLYGGKPVLAWSGGQDQHHVELLKDTGLLYKNKEEVLEKMNTLKNKNFIKENYANIVNKFSPENVMQIFSRVFL